MFNDGKTKLDINVSLPQQPGNGFQGAGGRAPCPCPRRQRSSREGGGARPGRPRPAELPPHLRYSRYSSTAAAPPGGNVSRSMAGGKARGAAPRTPSPPCARTDLGGESGPAPPRPAAPPPARLPIGPARRLAVTARARALPPGRPRGREKPQSARTAPPRPARGASSSLLSSCFAALYPRPGNLVKPACGKGVQITDAQNKAYFFVQRFSLVFERVLDMARFPIISRLFFKIAV